jgi:DNA-directed RNA polymerase specialized sigma24 family protein
VKHSDLPKGLLPEPRITNEVLEDWLHVKTQVYSFLRRRGARHEDAEDIVQNLALALATRSTRYDNVESWAMSTAHNLYRELVRAHKHYPTQSFEDWLIYKRQGHTRHNDMGELR